MSCCKTNIALLITNASSLTAHMREGQLLSHSSTMHLSGDVVAV